MRDFIEVFVGIILAFLLFFVLGKISASLLQLFNIFGLIVIFFSIKKGEIYGACLGTVCGLVQDAFSLGVFGVAGLSKTITGFLAGFISKKIDIMPLYRNFIFCLILLSLEFVLWTFLSSFVSSQKLFIGRTLYSLQPLSTAILGSFLFHLLRRGNFFSR